MPGLETPGLASWIVRGALGAALVAGMELTLVLALVPAARSSIVGLFCLVHAVFAMYALLLLPLSGLTAWLARRGITLPRVGAAALITAALAIGLAQLAIWALYDAAARYPEFPGRVGTILQTLVLVAMVAVALIARFAIYPLVLRAGVSAPARLERHGTLVPALSILGCPAAMALCYFGLGPVMLGHLSALTAAVSAACALGVAALLSGPLSARRATYGSAGLLVAIALAPLSCGHPHASYLLYNHALAAGPLAALARDVADLDGDGASSRWLGGADCAELDATRGPELREVPGDGVDQDCSGADGAPSEPPMQEGSAALPGWPCTPPTQPLSLVLVTMDAVAADALSPAVTPSLAGLAEESVTFTRAYTSATSTVESLAALFSGRSLASMTREGHDLELPSDLLAVRLGARGYRAIAVHALGLPDALHAGFEELPRWWRDATPGSGKERLESAVTTNAALRLAATAERPFFLWLHYFDAHAPYLPLEYRGPAATPYHREVAYVDLHVGRLLTGLARLEQTAVIVTADHGEELARRGIEGHGPMLYESSTRVPLMVRIPGCAPRRIDAPVTLAELGAAIAPIIGAAPAVPPAAPIPAVTEAVSDAALGRSVAGARYKLIIDVRNGGRLLFDLQADPDETRDLRDDLPEEAAELEAAYQRWLDRAGALAASPLDR